MRGCSKLKCVSLNISKLKHLEYVNFSDCGALTGVDLSGYPSDNIDTETVLHQQSPFPEVNLLGCFNLDPETVFHQQSIIFKSIILPSYTLFLAMLSPTLTNLTLKNIPSLVELPSSFQNLNQLKNLRIRNCRNLESLPSGINFQFLDDLSFNGCSRLRSFPEISTNISWLNLKETGIEEVPWRIEKFSNLKQLNMKGCSKLKCVSVNISKLKHLWDVDFSNCGALTRVDLSGYPSDNIDTETVLHQQSPFPRVNLMGCFNLDPETVLHQLHQLHQQSIIFNNITFSGEEVPSYFTHRTTGSSSLTIPLLHVPLSQPFFRLRVGAVNRGVIHINVWEFKGLKGFPTNSTDIWEISDNVLTMMDCHIPLNEDNAPLAQRNYDHVDMHIRIYKDPFYSDDDTLKVKGWGIRVLEECSLPENRLPHVSESDEDNLVNKTEHSEEFVEKVVKRQREIGSDCRLSEGPLKKPLLCSASDTQEEHKMSL